MSFLDSLFGLVGGSSAKTDRRQQLAGQGQLSNIFNFALPQAKTGYEAGQTTEKSALGELAGPASYYQSLLSGDRQKTLEAVAPVANAATASTDAQKRQLASLGTGRGGGTNATSQQLDTARMATVDSAINEAKGGAAAGEAKVAGETANVGGQQLSAALNLLGIGTKAAQDYTSNAEGSRATSYDIHNDAAKQAADAAGGLLDAVFA